MQRVIHGGDEFTDLPEAPSPSGIPSGYAWCSVNTLGYQKSIFLKKLSPLKPKIKYSNSLLYEIFTSNCKIERNAACHIIYSYFKLVLR